MLPLKLCPIDGGSRSAVRSQHAHLSWAHVTAAIQCCFPGILPCVLIFGILMLELKCGGSDTACLPQEMLKLVTWTRYMVACDTVYRSIEVKSSG